MQKTESRPKIMNNVGELNKVFITWSKLVGSACVFLLYGIILAQTGFFNLPLLALGFLAIVFIGKVPNSLVFLFREFFFSNFNFLRFAILISWVLWLIFLMAFSSFPAFSGRDEGSYANAAIYLTRFSSLSFHLPLLDHLKAEGPAHQSLNFPGFIIKGDNLSSQFNPAYIVWLGIFFSVTRMAASLILANGILILGGVTAFYLLLRLFAPRWISAAALLVILFNFLFIWFPRFTLSENLAFFAFFNLLLFLVLLRKSSDEKFLFPIAALAILFPLIRPEGWWLLVVTIILFCFWYLKRLVVIPKKYLTKLPIVLLGGVLFILYIIYNQLPVYRRLIRDWLKWPSTSTYYASMAEGHFSLTNLKETLLAVFPSWQRFTYFLRIEWNYGVLIFGIIALLVLMVFLLDRKKRFFSERKRILIGITALLSFPFFTAFFSPQISPDHPWMLRRFFWVVLPCGILASFLLLLELANKVSRSAVISLISLSLALLLVPSLSAGAYFLTLKSDSGREAVLKELKNDFQKEDFVFLSRESSGDGWRMWSEPLSSLYGVNAAYVYSPSNIVDFRQVLYDRFSEGKKSYVILPANAFDFEHELKKYFSLILDKELSFTNLEMNVQSNSGNTSFPILENREHLVKIYLLSPK